VEPSELTMPGAHGSQELLFSIFPAAHLMHSEAPIELIDPGAQSWQVLALGPENLPSSQNVQESFPTPE
jgi:hypothetical protein